MKGYCERSRLHQAVVTLPDPLAHQQRAAWHSIAFNCTRLACCVDWRAGNARAAWLRLRRSLNLHISTKNYPLTGRPHSARPSLLEGIDAWKELMRSGYSAVFSGKGFAEIASP